MLDNHRPATRTTRTDETKSEADTIDPCSAASDRTGMGRQHGLAEGHMLGIVRCRFEAEQRTDEAGDVRNGAGSLTPTAYRDRAEADTPHHLLRLQPHEEHSVGTATRQSPCLLSWPQYGGRHSRRVPEAESCRVALRDRRWSLWRTIASRWIDRVSCSWRGLCSERWRCLAHHGARTRPKTHCVESAQTVNMIALIRLA